MTLKIVRWLVVILCLVLTACATSIDSTECRSERARNQSYFNSLPDNDIAWVGIVLTWMNYEGNCPCPSSRAADGSTCGARSAYSRGGYRIHCTPSDIPVEDYSTIRRAAAHRATSIHCGGDGETELLRWK